MRTSPIIFVMVSSFLLQDSPLALNDVHNRTMSLYSSEEEPNTPTTQIPTITTATAQIPIPTATQIPTTAKPIIQQITQPIVPPHPTLLPQQYPTPYFAPFMTPTTTNTTTTATTATTATDCYPLPLNYNNNNIYNNNYTNNNNINSYDYNSNNINSNNHNLIYYYPTNNVQYIYTDMRSMPPQPQEFAYPMGPNVQQSAGIPILTEPEYVL